MTNTRLRKEVHGFVDQVDENVLKMIHAMLKEYTAIYELSPEQENELNERRVSYKAGKSKVYTVEEARVQLKKLTSKK